MKLNTNNDGGKCIITSITNLITIYAINIKYV